MAGSADGPPAGKQARFLGSLRDALAAAGREEQPVGGVDISRTVRLEATHSLPAAQPAPAKAADEKPAAAPATPAQPAPAAQPPSAAEAARAARATPTVRPDRHVEADNPPTTRVVRGGGGTLPKGGDEPARTQLVRGKAQVKRDRFHQDPVVAFLVVVGGPGLGSYRPVFEGNNTLGRASSQRVPIDFGDDAISSEEQAFIRYDSADRAFLFVPNLAKTNVVQVNDKKPTAAVPLSAMDVITVGRTQLVFVPFCGPDFDWSELAEAKS
jgi:hypothetical protein